MLDSHTMIGKLGNTTDRMRAINMRLKTVGMHLIGNSNIPDMPMEMPGKKNEAPAPSIVEPQEESFIGQMEYQLDRADYLLSFAAAMLNDLERFTLGEEQRDKLGEKHLEEKRTRLVPQNAR